MERGTRHHREHYHTYKHTKPAFSLSCTVTPSTACALERSSTKNCIRVRRSSCCNPPAGPLGTTFGETFCDAEATVQPPARELPWWRTGGEPPTLFSPLAQRRPYDSSSTARMPDWTIAILRKQGPWWRCVTLGRRRLLFSSPECEARF
jgi:hypothetical protein